MAPGSSNNQNNNRQTGTKPKSKASKKNAVPQEIVAPTRRDQLQQQLNVLVDWATVSGASSVVQNNNTQQQPQQQHFSGVQHPPTSGQQQHQQQSQGQNVLLKPRNNRTPGEGTCYEIDNLSLQDNSRYIPVRPIVRRNLLNESASGEQNEPHNTAVGVVIPTTPNSALQQTFRLNEGASASGSGGPIGSTHSVNNLLHSGASAGHSASGGASSTGVIPKQQHILNPLLLLQQQQQQQLHQQQQQTGQTRSTSSPLSYRVPDGASQNQLNLNKNSNHQQQQQQQQHQQQYNQPHLATAAVPSTSSGSRYGSATLPFNTAGATVEETLNQIQEYIKLTTNLISSVQIDNLNGGPRPQSVQSISTNQSTTPVPPSASCDELRYRMETQSKNMQALKEQQAHLLRLQQAARQQLQEMESIRHMHSASVAPPIESFQTVEQVQDGIGSIMERMRVLSTFIQNQQELSNMLGPEHDADVMADQVILQQKFAELRDKKSQMHNLVSELQNLNMDANRQFDGEAVAVPAEPRNVPIELTHAPAPASDARNATKIFLNGGGSTMEGTSGGLNPVATVEGMSVPAHRQLGEEQRANGHMASSAAVDEEDDEGQLNEEEASVLNGTADMLSEKINEINAMKSQLRRLKEMMDTVKLIEMKTGHESIDEEEEDEEDAPEDEEEGDDEEEEGATAIAMQQQQQQQQQQQPPHARSSRSRSRSMSSAPITLLPDGTTIPNEADGSELSNQEREQLNKRVEALHAMTQDLREQAKSIAAERDRLKHARNDLHKRRNNVMELQQQAQHQSTEKLTNHVASFVSLAGPSGRVPAGPKERQQMELKAELEQKRRELERIEKMTQSIKKNTELSRSAATEGVGAHEPTTSAHDPKPAGPSSVVSSSVESCSGGAGSHHRGTPSTHTTIPPAPAPSAISGSLQNNTAGSNATNDSKTNSADSGVTSDIFAHAQLESASYQSSSTRSFPPPMPDICNRNAAADRYRMKRSELDADGAPVGGGGGGAAGARDHRGSSPWPVFGTSGGAGGLSSSNTGPHSPHYGHPYGPGMHDLSHHAPGAGYVGVGVGAYGSSWSTGGGPYGVAANLLPPHAATPNTPPDPIVFQHIMQTQQMLMNSITQCNQLLWIQQREINNLNNAVLLLQERILGTNSSMLLHETHGPPMAATLIRAESTPPNNSSLNASNAAATTASSMYTRARSEQPMMSHQQSSPYHHPHALHHPTPSSMLQSMPPFTQQPPYSPHAAMPPNHALMSPQPLVPNASQCLPNQPLPRNNTNPLAGQAGLPPSGASAGRLRSSVRPLNINTLNNALYDEQSGGGGGGVAAGTDVGLANEYGNTGSVAPNMINNLCSSSSQPATPTPAMGQQQQQQQPHHHQPHSSSSLRFGQNYNNLNNTVNNNLSNANMQNNHNLYSQQQQQQPESSSQQQTQALNNQVLPGVRANNYWDNFRSYSRQNLLSSNSCKSNEESCSQSGSAGGGGSGGSGGAVGSGGVAGAGAGNGIGCAGSGTVSGGGGGAGFSGGSAGGGTGCNTINNQLQRNNSNASNQYMNNQSNKYQQSLNITRNNSLSNANQANSAGLCQELDSSMSHGYHPNQDGSMTDDCAGQMVDHHHQQQQQQVVQQQAPLPNVGGQPMQGARAAQQTFQSQQPILPGRQQHRGQPVGTVQAQHPYGHTHQPSVQPQSVQSQHSSSGLVHQPSPHQQQIAPQQQQHQQQQAHSHHAPLNQSNSLDLGELQFHTNPINLGLANKTHPKASGHKKYPLSLRSCRDAGAGGEGSSGCYVSGGGDMNLASTCTYQHDSKSTSKLFEALKENVYQEVKNLITANESRPHFLIQLFRELQLISSDPLRQRTLQSIQELYNRYIESTLQEENHVNNVGSNNLLASSGLANMPEGVNVGGESINAEQPRNTPPREQRSEESTVELEVVQNYTNLRQQQQQQQQQQYHYIPAAGSDQTGGNLPATSAGEVLAGGSLPNAPSTSSNSPPGAGRRLSAVRPLNQEQLVPLAVANSEIINIIMGDIVSVINSVDYINDSVLFKIAGVICNHATGGASMDYGQPSGDAGQQHHHHHHHQHHYHHHHARTGQSPAASLLAAASFLSAQGDDPQAGGGDMSSGAAGAGSAGGDVFSREDFLRHLESWNRTDKDEFISNLENFLNNILLRSSAVEGEEGDEEEDAITGVPLSVGGQQSAAYVNEVLPDGAIGYEGGTAGNPGGSDVGGNGNGIVPFSGEEQRPLESAVVVSSSSSNVVYSSTTYDLAEADQVCDMENPSGNSMAAGGPSGGASSAAIEHPTGGTNFDDRWTVVVQKKPATSAVEEQQVGANGRDEGRTQPRMGGMQQQQQQQQQTHGGMNGGPSSTNGNIPPGGGGNNGNNINNNWQSEEVADEHLEQTEEHRSSYY